MKSHHLIATCLLLTLASSPALSQLVVCKTAPFEAAMVCTEGTANKACKTVKGNTGTCQRVQPAPSSGVSREVCQCRSDADKGNDTGAPPYILLVLGGLIGVRLLISGIRSRWGRPA